MGINFKESGDTIVAEKDGNNNWVLYNQALYSASDPWIKIDDDTGEVTVNHGDLDLNGNSINNVSSVSDLLPVKNVRNYGAKGNDSTDDIIAINNAVSQQGLIYFPPGTYNISSSILIKDDTLLLLDNCTIYLENGADTNVIRNNDITNGNDNIGIQGRGRVILDGNAINQNRTSKDPKWIGLRFVLGNNYYFDGFTIKNTAAWGIKTEGISDIKIGILEFSQNGLQANQDGYHLSGGGNIHIDKLIGTTYDDMFIMDCLDQPDAFVENKGQSSISNVSVSYVENDQHNAVRILAGDNNTIENVFIDEIYHEDSSTVGLDCWGDYTSTNSSTTDFRNIEIGSITSKYKALEFEGGGWGDISIERIDCESPASYTQSDALSVVKIKPNTTVEELDIGKINSKKNNNLFYNAGTMNRCNIDTVTARDLFGNVFVSEGTISNTFIGAIALIQNIDGNSNVIRTYNNGSISSLFVGNIYTERTSSSTNTIKIIQHDAGCTVEDLRIQDMAGTFTNVINRGNTTDTCSGFIRCHDYANILGNVRGDNGTTNIRWDVTGFYHEYAPDNIPTSQVVADGINWDPTGNGNPAYMMSGSNNWHLIVELD